MKTLEGELEESRKENQDTFKLYRSHQALVVQLKAKTKEQSSKISDLEAALRLERDKLDKGKHPKQLQTELL